MADTTKSGTALDNLDAMIEAEKAQASWHEVGPSAPLAIDEGDDDLGLFTSAPSSDEVGSLLTDLLNEAKKEVERERAEIEQKLKDKHDEERLAKEREEAQRREELQAQLREETMRRNAALTRREREEAEERAAAEADAQASKEAAAAAAAAAPISEAPATHRPGLAADKEGGKGGLIAFLVVIIAGAAGGAYWYTQKDLGPIQLSDVRGKATAVVSEAASKWKAQKAEEARIAAEKKAAERKKRAEEAKRKAAEAEAKRKELEAARLAAAEEAARLAAEEEEAKKKAARKRKPAGKKLKIDTGVFK